MLGVNIAFSHSYVKTMSLHKRVTFSLIQLRSRIIDLNALTHDPVSKACLVDMQAQIEAMVQMADERLIKRREGRSTLGFDGLEVGHGFFVEADRIESARAAASAYGKRNGQRWGVVKQDDGRGFVHRKA